MYARVVRAHVAPGKVEEAIHILEERVAPDAASQPGFEGMLALSDPVTGQGMVITLWATAPDLIMGETGGYLGRQLALLAPWLSGPALRETYHVVMRTSAGDRVPAGPVAPLQRESPES